MPSTSEASQQLQLLTDESHFRPRSNTLRKAISDFAEFPYTQRPYAARNWGHPLHSLCSYASKMKPAIASFLIQYFVKPGATVLDPFAGSGTIPFEAAMQGRKSLAFDLSPLAASITTAKLNPPDSESVLCVADELQTYIETAACPDESAASVEEEIKSFFHERTLGEVLLAKRWLEEHEAAGLSGAEHRFIKACILHILHGNRPYALSRRSHGIIPIPPKGPATYKSLANSLKEKITRTALDRIPDTFARGRVERASALDMPADEGSVDVIATSPPFFGTTEFLRQNRVRLWFSGWDYAEQARMKESGDFVEYHKSLDVYGTILAEFRRVLVSDGLVILHLGVVRGRDMGLQIGDLAEEQGFSIEALLYEDTSRIESHGRTAKGGTTQHQFLFLRRAC